MHSFLLVGPTYEKPIEQLLLKHHVDPPDVLSIQETPITIKMIRQLKSWASRKPYQSPIKAAVIYNLHHATIPAQNALLKTLEEPPPNTIIILTTSNQHLLLPTIISRCQILSSPEVTLDGSSGVNPNMDALLQLLPSLSPGERINRVGEYAKSRADALAFVESLINIIRQKPNPKLRLVVESYQQLKANVNPKLVLEHLFLHLS